MKKILLTAVLVVLSTSSVAHAQLSPTPDPGPAPEMLSCRRFKDNIDAIQVQIDNVIYWVVEKKRELDERAKELAKYEEDLNYAVINGLGYTYIRSLIALIDIGKENLKVAEEAYQTAQDLSKIVLSLLKAKLSLAKEQYSIYGCLPLLP